MSKTEKKIRKSIFAEFTLLSGGALVLILGLIALCVFFYIYMAVPPSKKVILRDDADILSEEEESRLLELEKHLSSDEDINVLIVTTRNKGEGYTNSDEDCARYAGDFYKENAMSKYFKDNSGICILLDYTLDRPGQRFFWLYTYGTAHYQMPDAVVTEIFNDQMPDLIEGRICEALENILEEVDAGKIRSTEITGLYVILAAVPLLLSGFVLFWILRPRRLDPAPDSSAYMMKVTEAGGELKKVSSHTTEIAWLAWILQALLFILEAMLSSSSSSSSSGSRSSSRSSGGSSRSSSSGSSRSSGGGGRSGGGGGRF